MPKERAPGSLTDQQLLQAIRAIVQRQQSGGSGTSSSSGTVTEESIGDIIGDILGEIVVHVVGAAPDIILEVVTEGVPDVGDLADIVGDIVLDIGKEVVIHLIVDVILDLSLRPIDPQTLKDKGITAVAMERLAHAKLALELASQRTPAPSSRELAALRKILLQAKAKK
jgi:hypothetical protein